MSRVAREKSSSNIYHVMMRGNNRSRIFFDNEDYRHFRQILKECKDVCEYHLYAYCLMDNHVHLLIQVDKEPLELIMKRIGTRFVIWYNSEYSRVGHLFQDRYKSEPVESESYFFTVLRYILNNPVKAGLCQTAKDYPWSSAVDYFSGGGITDTSFAEKINGRENLLIFLEEPSDEVCMDDTVTRLNDIEAQKAICRILKTDNISECSKEINAHPEEYVKLLRTAGLSFRQISRLTGLSYFLVQKYSHR